MIGLTVSKRINRAAERNTSVIVTSLGQTIKGNGSGRQAVGLLQRSHGSHADGVPQLVHAENIAKYIENIVKHHTNK